MNDRSGNFMMMFGLSVGVLFVAAGLAVEYSQSLLYKTRINNALDAATLATGRALSIGEISKTGDAAENYFKAIFAANMGDDSFDATAYTLESFDVNTSNQTVSGRVSIKQPLKLLRVGTGTTEQKIASYSAASFGIGSVEVAMVLDVTGSMGSGNNSKLENLKDAAQIGVAELLAANTATDENIRISLVPYNYGVNVGSQLAKYVYPDYRYSKSDAPIYDAKMDSDSAEYDATQDPGGYGLGFDVASYIKDYDVCYKLKNNKAKVRIKIKASDIDDYWCPTDTSVDNLPSDFEIEDDFSNVDNCATDRKAPYSGGTNYQYSSANPSKGMISRDSRIATCPASPLVLLTSSESDLDTAIENLNSGGYTAGQIGLMWAWYTISYEWADYFDGTASDPGDMATDDDLAKYIILMTDGIFNTAYAGNNSSSNVTSQSTKSENRAKQLCTKIKNQGIKIFTIGYETPSSADTMLQACASPTEGTLVYHYEPETAEDLRETYQKIANLIRTLRLTQ
ncbi:pilus assembly protein [Nitratireductor sp. XY-223]|uniref:pilus assembly protein n=1 Tax=Nitratireductor sp. XY-223 TaxID=2561926 RepID=UPI00145A0649|nr:pilus assembly protein [Nitratireductor sp. XY-223]